MEKQELETFDKESAGIAVYFTVYAFDSSDAVSGEIYFESFDAASRVAKQLLCRDLPKTQVVLERYGNRSVEATRLETYKYMRQLRKQLNVTKSDGIPF